MSKLKQAKMSSVHLSPLLLIANKNYHSCVPRVQNSQDEKKLQPCFQTSSDPNLPVAAKRVPCDAVATLLPPRSVPSSSSKFKPCSLAVHIGWQGVRSDLRLTSIAAQTQKVRSVASVAKPHPAKCLPPSVVVVLGAC